MRSTSRRARGTAGPWAVLVLVSVAFRWPALINASTVDSDAAVVGLQAMHILNGEFAWLLWGSGYQTSVDSLVAAGWFAFLGATPLALMLSTLSGHVAATLLAYATLARHVAKWTAVLATLPLVFTPSPLHTYILGPPRQASITLVFLAVWLIDGAELQRHRIRGPWRFAGGAVASLACFADPYALLFLPALLLFALLRARKPEVLRRFGTTLAGAAAGIVPLLLLLSTPKSVHGEASFTASVLRHNLSLLWEPCLPWVLSTTVYVPVAGAGYLPWHAGAFRVIEIGGVILLFGTIAFGVTRPAHPSAAQALGVYGVVVQVVTLAAFLVSPMVMDLFSARYLAAMVLMAPFALAPAAARIRPRTLGALLFPYLLSAAVSGWLGFGDRVRGPLPVRLPGAGALDEARLGTLLKERGVTHAVADYWVSYRMTFLFQEAIQVVPIHAKEDRYAPYRHAFEGATQVAYVFDAERSREKLVAMLDQIAADETYGKPKETLQVGALTAIVLERP